LFDGFKVNSSGIDMEDRKIAAINHGLVPASTAQLRLFLGLAAYYRILVHKFAHRTTQLYGLTPNSTGLQWLRKNQAEFNVIRRALASAPVLELCDPERDYILHTNASDVAIGDILAQKHHWGPEGQLVERQLGFISPKLHDIETRYAVYACTLVSINNNLIHTELDLSK
jgi:hypothetical protein